MWIISDSRVPLNEPFAHNTNSESKRALLIEMSDRQTRQGLGHPDVDGVRPGMFMSALDYYKYSVLCWRQETSMRLYKRAIKMSVCTRGRERRGGLLCCGGVLFCEIAWELQGL